MMRSLQSSNEELLQSGPGGRSREMGAPPSTPATSRPGSRSRSHGIRHTLELHWELVLRDLRIRYKRSYLGLAWSLLNPLSQIVIFSFLFGMVMPLAIENYTIFVFCGVLSWTWFSTSLISVSL